MVKRLSSGIKAIFLVIEYESLNNKRGDDFIKLIQALKRILGEHYTENLMQSVRLVLTKTQKELTAKTIISKIDKMMDVKEVEIPKTIQSSANESAGIMSYVPFFGTKAESKKEPENQQGFKSTDVNGLYQKVQTAKANEEEKALFRLLIQLRAHYTKNPKQILVAWITDNGEFREQIAAVLKSMQPVDKNHFNFLESTGEMKTFSRLLLEVENIFSFKENQYKQCLDKKKTIQAELAQQEKVIDKLKHDIADYEQEKQKIALKIKELEKGKSELEKEKITKEKEKESETKFIKYIDEQKLNKQKLIKNLESDNKLIYLKKIDNIFKHSNSFFSRFYPHSVGELTCLSPSPFHNDYFKYKCRFTCDHPVADVTFDINHYGEDTKLFFQNEVKVSKTVSGYQVEVEIEYPRSHSSFSIAANIYTSTKHLNQNEINTQLKSIIEDNDKIQKLQNNINQIDQEIAVLNLKKQTLQEDINSRILDTKLDVLIKNKTKNLKESEEKENSLQTEINALTTQAEQLRLELEYGAELRGNVQQSIKILKLYTPDNGNNTYRFYQESTDGMGNALFTTTVTTSNPIIENNNIYGCS